MTPKEILSTIRGWFPQEPYLPQKVNLKGAKSETPLRPFFARSPLGLKLVAALFWIFGVIAGLMVIDQFRIFVYLPFNVRGIITAITIMDAVAMFVIGVGLLTMKKRWINIALIFSIISIMVFYIIPLRAALPLELVAIAYLLTLRKGFVSKRIVPTGLSAVSVALVLLVCSSMFVPVYAQNTDLINPSKTITENYYLTSDKGDFGANVIIYRIGDMDNERDYYLLEVNLNSSKGGFNYAKVNVSFSQIVTIFPSWKPQSNPTTATALSLGVASIYIGNTDNVVVDVKHEESICWIKQALSPIERGVFSTELIVNQDAHFNLNLTAEAGLNDKIFGNLWIDHLEMESGGI